MQKCDKVHKDKTLLDNLSDMSAIIELENSLPERVKL
jgi:hypothetical protein